VDNRVTQETTGYPLPWEQREQLNLLRDSNEQRYQCRGKDALLKARMEVIRAGT
jgi:hypothetical protein